MGIPRYIITGISFLRQKKKRELIRLAFRWRKRHGIEIGGPSNFFRLKAYFPIYIFAKRIDGVNFSNNTVWEGTIKEGNTFNYYPGKTGHQYIGEATDLNFISANSYDFLLSCHNLEHVANPIRALLEWKRVLKNGGSVVLVLPDKRSTFDVNRSYTTFSHLLTDFEMGVNEADTTHFAELLEKFDFTKDKHVKSKEELAKMLNDNKSNRCAHHHVFNQDIVRQMFEYCDFKVNYQLEIEQFHLLTVASKK